MTWRYRYDYFPAKMNQRFKKTKTYIDGLKSYNRMHTWEIIHISLKPNPVYIYIHILHLHIHTHVYIYKYICNTLYIFYTVCKKHIVIYICITCTCLCVSFNKPLFSSIIIPISLVKSLVQIVLMVNFTEDGSVHNCFPSEPYNSPKFPSQNII